MESDANVFGLNYLKEHMFSIEYRYKIQHAMKGSIFVL